MLSTTLRITSQKNWITGKSQKSVFRPLSIFSEYSAGYELADGPEVEITHWFYKEGNESLNTSRYLELWLPIVKKDASL